VLVQPLLGLPHWVGVVLVGSVVILIVVTAGMVSTTWVQFIKGSLLIVFSAVLVAAVLWRGITAQSGGNDGYRFQKMGPLELSWLPSGAGELPVESGAPWSRGEPELRIDATLYSVYRPVDLLPFRDESDRLHV